MCASVYSSLLLLTLTTIFVIFGTRMATEGLPLNRQERGVDRGILAGEDFLSVFMSSSLRQDYRERITTTTPEPSTLPITTFDYSEDENETYVRGTRSTSQITSPSNQDNVEEHTRLYDSTLSADREERNQEPSSESSLSDGVIVAVHVSASVGRTLINKDNRESESVIEDTTIRESTTETTTTVLPDLNFIASEEHPSIVAESNKNEFSVEESEPITTNSDLTSAEFSRGYPASVQTISRDHPYHHSTDFVSETLSQNKDKIKPLHETVIYHNNPREPGRARSVSYSTVIQAVPHASLDKWETDKFGQHDRLERHYGETSFNNNFQDNLEKLKLNDSMMLQSSAESKELYVTANPLNQQERREENWEKLEETYLQESTTRRNILTTEKNWEVQERPYAPPPQRRLPTVYGVPEQNYEVDESASVMTNGRVHGVQSSPAPSKQESKKTDDNQKVGYVVEGRNYRKYRVEERTSDGFIVGEYGVVSHDDGSLRGVRYTADGGTSPRLIYDALMKFLSL